MRKVVTAIVIAAMVLAVVAAACGGATNQTITPGESPTSAAPLPSVSPTGGGTPTGTPTGGGTATPSADGAAIFAADCATCHGAKGTGGFGPNITNIRDLARVKNQVENGGAQMPAFKGQLTPAEIQAVATFVAGGLKS